MVKKYKTKETGIILFLTFSALSISGAVTGVSFLAREIVNIALGNSQSWNKSIFLGALFLGAMILFLVFKNIGIRKIILYKKDLNGGIFHSLLLKKDFVNLRDKRGEAVTVIVDDTNKVCGFIENTLPPLLETLIVSVIMGAMTLFINRVIFVIVLGLSFVSALAIFFSKKIQAYEKDNYEKKDEINQELTDIFKFIGIASSIRNTGLIIRNIDELIKLQNGIEYKKRRLSIVFEVAARLCGIIREVFIIIYGIKYVGFDIGMVVAMLNVTSFFNEIVNMFGDLVIKLAQVKIPVGRINAILEQEETDDSNIAASVNSLQELRVENLGYSYDETNGIFDVSFSAARGYIHIIKGEIGSGKSTIGKILCGVLPGFTGSVYGDNERIDSDSLRKTIAYVDQEAVISIGSIEENISSYDEMVDEKKLWQAIKVCGLKDWVSGLDKSIKTMLYSEEINLSGGQKQRIAIARAIYKDSPVIVLDEPTSALDEDNAGLIWDLLNNLKEEKILLIITHDTRILNSRKSKVHQIQIQDGRVIADEMIG